MIRQRRRAAACAVLACTSVALCTAGLARTSAARAQSAPYFSPTYAASEGSPYSSIYAQTFGAGGPPVSQAPATPAAAAPLAGMVVLSGVFMAMTFVVFVGYGLAASAVRTRVLASARIMAWMRRTFAAAFVALGAKLALTAR